MRRTTLLLLIGLTVSLPETKAIASGYGVFTQGAAALGQANAVVAHATGPSSAYFNPALLTAVPGTQLEVGSTGIYARHKVDFDAGGSDESENGWEFPGTFYLSHRIDDRMTAGLAVFFPFGLSTEWDDDWQGRYIGTYGEIVTANINPVVAFKVSDRLSLAAGAAAVYFDATLKSRINQTAVGLLVNPPTGLGPLPDIEQKFTGDDWGFGGNLALAAQLTDRLSFGAAWRSKIELDVDGKANLRGVAPPLSGLFADTGGKASITLPQQLAAGIAWRFSEALVAEAGGRWEDWESTDELIIKLDSPVFFQTQQVVPRDWHATWTYNLGGQYRVSPELAINAGYLFGENAVPDRTMDVLIPDADAHLFTMGAEWRHGPWTFAGALGYEHHEGRRKENAIADPFGSLAAGMPVNTANGRFETDIYLLALSLGYKF